MEQENREAFPVLTTQRLNLRKLSGGDVQEIFLLRSNASINRYLYRQPCRTLEDALGFIDTVKSSSTYYWAITQKGHDKLIGTICLFNVSAELSTGEIGYELLTEYQGRGIMEEAAAEVIKYAFQTLALKAIDAYTHKSNQRSTNMLKKLNFRCIVNTDNAESNLILFRLDHL